MSVPLLAVLEHRRTTAAQYDIELVGAHVHRNGRIHVEWRHQSLDCILVRDRLDDRADPDQRVTLEIHLRDQPLCEAMAENGEMDVRRAPVIHPVRPWIGTGLDGLEPVVAILVCDRTPDAA